jgi:hypothetical protein
VTHDPNTRRSEEVPALLIDVWFACDGNGSGDYFLIDKSEIGALSRAAAEYLRTAAIVREQGLL